jgi:DNA-binding MarR family transcriptional regulator
MELAQVSNEVSLLVRKVRQYVKTSTDRSISGIGLTIAQYSALACLAESSGLSNAELARKSSVTHQTMSLIVQNLEEQGLVQRMASQTHGRIQNIVLTDAGLAVLQVATNKVQEVHREIFGRLNGEEAEQLIMILQKLLKTEND